MLQHIHGMITLYLSSTRKSLYSNFVKETKNKTLVSSMRVIEWTLCERKRLIARK